MKSFNSHEQLAKGIKAAARVFTLVMTRRGTDLIRPDWELWQLCSAPETRTGAEFTFSLAQIVLPVITWAEEKQSSAAAV